MTHRLETITRALSEKDHSDPIPSPLTVTPGNNAQNIRFGIEVECYLPNRYKEQIKVGNYHNGLPIPVAPVGWNAQRDASLGQGPTGYFPVEIVSPILSGEEGLGQITYMMELLGMLKAVVSPSCGIHVHVESASMTFNQLETLAIAFKHYEAFFYGLNGREGSQRLESSYCAPSYKWSKMVDTSIRYRALNFATQKVNGTFSRGNTVEFRLFAGVLKPEFIVTAVYSCVGLVSHVINDAPEYPVSLPMGTQININKLAKQFYKNVWGKDTNKIFGDEPMLDVKGYISNQLARFQPSQVQKDRLMLA